MADDLFRPEALKAQSGQRWGRPVGLLPVAWSRITLLLTLFVVSLVIFISVADFSRSETVRGRLRPTTSEARVFVSEAGVLTRLHVGLGDTVSAGDMLAEVTTTRQIDLSTNVSAATLEDLDKEKDALEGQKRAILQAAELSRQRLQIDINNQRAERSGLTNTRDLAARRIVIAEERLATSSKLRQEGASSREDERAREEALIVLKQQFIEVSTRISGSKAKEEFDLIDLHRVDSDTARELADIDGRLLQVQSQTTQARAAAGFVVKAPIAGKIGALQAANGERVDPSQPLLAILPAGGELVAEVYVPSRAIAFIEPGQAVRLDYDAFPLQKFGAAGGKVTSVSKTTLTPQELRGSMQTKEPVYRVVIALDHQTVPAFGKQIPLQAGMELSAQIVLEKRKLGEWLLAPMYAAIARAQNTP